MLTIARSVPPIRKRISELLQQQHAVIVAIAGGSGSGKTTLAKQLPGKQLHLDHYYRPLHGQYHNQNRDTPAALDLRLARRHLNALRMGRAIRMPLYSFHTHRRMGYRKFSASRVIIVEGLFALHPTIRAVADVRIFVNAPAKLRLARRLKRDVKTRSETKAAIIARWRRFVEPAYQRMILPTKRAADFVVSGT